MKATQRIRLTETTEIYQSETGHAKDGSEILTVTLWADDERIQNFGGGLCNDPAKVRQKAADAANKFAGLTGADVQAYDAWIAKMDNNDWSQ